MDDNKGLKILGEILDWSDDEARAQFAWLKMMAAVKYDDYRDFLPGMRFLENLAAWLQQFDALSERRTAYDLLRKRLIFVSPSEMQRLVELFYPCFIERRLIEVIAARRCILAYQVRVDPEARADLARLRRRTLILGLSDGARIDILRHSTVNILSNEQFAIQTQLDPAKWESMLKDLRDAQPDDPKAAFEVVFLVDDFMGTGSSYLRFDEEKGRWTGKLCKFLHSLELAREHDVHLVADGWQLCVHHYLSTQRAANDIPPREAKAIAEGVKLEHPSRYTFGAVVPVQEEIDDQDPANTDLIALVKKYYNTGLETKHTMVGGEKNIGLGYGKCRLPLVLHHNTPNNALALIWAELPAGVDKTTQEPQPEMRPLFRRRQRHTGAA